MRSWPVILLVALMGLVLTDLLNAAELDGVVKMSLPGSAPHTGAGAPKPDRIWSGVIVATNPATPKEPPTELREVAPRLRRIFGYSQFELVGSATEVID